MGFEKGIEITLFFRLSNYKGKNDNTINYLMANFDSVKELSV